MEIRKLASIANKLDSLGLTKEADVIDRCLTKIAANRVILSNNATMGAFCDTASGQFVIKSDEVKRDILDKIKLIKQQDSFDDTLTYKGAPVLNLYIAYYLINPSLPFSEAMYGDASKQTALEAAINKYRRMGMTGSGTGKGTGVAKSKAAPGKGSTTGAAAAKGTASATGGGDSWAKYIATAKDPKTGMVDTALNTRVKDVWQSTNPANKEFSGFTEWYARQKENMNALKLGAKDFGQEQAIALIQITSGSGKDWQNNSAALTSVYKNVVTSQDPSSFNPSSIGLGRSGEGYMADLKGYIPTEGRTADPAKALLRNQIAVPAEREYAGNTKDTLRDEEEFSYEKGVEEQVARRMSGGTQAMKAAPPKSDMDRRTNRLSGGSRRTDLRDYTDEDGNYIDESGKKIR